MFPEAPESVETSHELLELAAFLSDEAEAVGRAAARALTAGLPIFATTARRRLRRQITENLRELSRHLQNFGTEGPRLYGESQRRFAAVRLAEGASLQEALEERAVVYDAVINRWAEERGPIPGQMARVLAHAFVEVASHIAELWLTYQRSESVAFQEAALLDTIVHHLDEAILVAEPDGSFSYVSPALEKIIGVQTRFLIGMSPERMAELVALRDRDGNLVPPEELPHRRALQTGEIQHADFVMLRRADGTDAVCELFATPVFDEEEGRLRGAVVTLRDRTQSFLQTQALENAFTELRLMHARMLSRSRLEATGELASSIAHALNNQLNVITLRLRKLSKVPGAEKDSEGIGKSVREIATLVKRLQEFAVAPQATAPEAVDLEKLVHETLDLLHAQLGPRAQQQVVTHLESTPKVLANRDVLLELLDAMLLGGLDTTPPDEPVELRSATAENWVALQVLVRGEPMGPEAAARLFEPLTPGATTRSVAFAAGRQAVERWGGSARAYPDGEGHNVFEVRLRIYEAAEQG